MISLGGIQFFKQRGTSTSLASSPGPGGLILASIDQNIHRNTIDSTGSNSLSTINENDSNCNEEIEGYYTEEEGILEEKEDARTMPVELSIWSISNGYQPLGSVNIKYNTTSIFKVLNDTCVAIWNSSGDKICLIVFGELIMVDLIWKYKNSKDPCSYFKACMKDDTDSSGSSDDYNSMLLVECELNTLFRKQLEAVSLCLCTGGRHLLVGTDRGNGGELYGRGNFKNHIFYYLISNKYLDSNF